MLAFDMPNAVMIPASYLFRSISPSPISAAATAASTLV
jgi:hypothetical protein